MAWFKKQNPYPADCRWNVFQGKNGDRPMIVRKNESAGVLKTHGAYCARVGFAVRFLEATVDGLPSPRELPTLNHLEDALAVAMEANEDAIHVLTITTSGFREHVFYSKETKPLEPVVHTLKGKFRDYELSTYAEEDGSWQGYSQFPSVP
jgi:hypothetical protein